MQEKIKKKKTYKKGYPRTATSKTGHGLFHRPKGRRRVNLRSEINPPNTTRPDSRMGSRLGSHFPYGGRSGNPIGGGGVSRFGHFQWNKKSGFQRWKSWLNVEAWTSAKAPLGNLCDPRMIEVEERAWWLCGVAEFATRCQKAEPSREGPWVYGGAL